MGDSGPAARTYLELLSVGTVLVACVVLGYLLGAVLDRRWGTGPWMVVAGTVLGTVAGFVQLFRTITRTLK